MFVRNLMIAFGLVVGSGTIAQSQQPESVRRPYDGIQAGIDAYHLAEGQRQADVSQQLFLNDQMRFFSGYSTSSAQTIYYGFPTPLLTRANLDFVYADGAALPWGGPFAVFQPWPYVPGDIYGYPARYQPARQPIGRQEIQTGPNRWESHPIYAPALRDPALPAEPVPPPPPAPKRGRREY